MNNLYSETVDEISKLAEKYSDDYELSNVLKSGISKILKLQENSGNIIKKASLESREDLNKQ